MSGYKSKNRIKKGKKKLYIIGILVVLAECILLGICVSLFIEKENLPEAAKDTSPSVLQETEELKEQQILSESDPEPESKPEPESEPVLEPEPKPQKSEEELVEEYVETVLSEMTLEEKVLQLFMITPNALTGYGTVTAAGGDTKDAIHQYPVGGIIYFAENLHDPEQVQTMLSNTLQYYEDAGYPAPFLGVDEEGGTVARIGNQAAFSVESIPDMRAIGDSGDTQEAKRVGRVIGTYLSQLGFSMDFAPVADVLTSSENKVIGRRSFGTDPHLVSDMVLAETEGLEESGIWAVLKHYPGHGATQSDSHKGYACTDKSLEELMEAELVPFQEGIQSGIHFIMVSHISVPQVTGDNTPCSLSEYMITEVLREKLGFNGVVVTDAMNMGAISQQYSSAEASVLALQAGVDLLLMPADFHSAYEGVLNALETGVLTETEIEESVKRILRVKYEATAGLDNT